MTHAQPNPTTEPEVKGSSTTQDQSSTWGQSEQSNNANSSEELSNNEDSNSNTPWWCFIPLLCGIDQAEARDSSRTFPEKQCTWFVANQTERKDDVWSWLPNSNADAKNWDDYARSAGWPVDNNPQDGDILVLEPGCYSANELYGHVAYVMSVSDNSIHISEYNGLIKDEYSERDIIANSCSMSFIHHKTDSTQSTNQEVTNSGSDDLQTSTFCSGHNSWGIFDFLFFLIHPECK